jgi:hypothetical protein
MITSLALTVIAAFFFGMTETSLGRGGGGTLATVGILAALLAIRFNWARITAAVVLALQTVLWLPGAFPSLSSDAMDVQTAATYVLVAVALAAVGLTLLFRPPANRFYAEVASWREHRRTVRG